MSEAEAMAMADGAGGFDRPEAQAPSSPSQSSSVDELLQRIHGLDAIDSGMWAKGLLIIVVLCAGFLALVFPNLVWNLDQMRVDTRFLPQFFFGLIALVALYNAYMVEQRKKLQYAREEMVRQLLRAETTENLTLVDPLTEIYNRRYLDKILRREMSRADRSGKPLSVMMIDLDGFKSINTRFGHLVGDRALREVAQLLNRVFRRSDTIVRYGGDEFLIVMPDTSQAQGASAIARLQNEVTTFNQEKGQRKYSLGLSCGVAEYQKGREIRDVIGAADESMYNTKARRHAAAHPAPPASR